MLQKFVVGTAAVMAICSALLTSTNDASAMSAGMRLSQISTSFGGRPEGISSIPAVASAVRDSKTHAAARFHSAPRV